MENLNPLRQSNFSTARSRPRLPSWTRSPRGSPVAEKRRAMDTTRRRLDSIILRRAHSPWSATASRSGRAGSSAAGVGEFELGVQAGLIGLGQLDLVLLGEQRVPTPHPDTPGTGRGSPGRSAWPASRRGRWGRGRDSPLPEQLSQGGEAAGVHRLLGPLILLPDPRVAPRGPVVVTTSTRCRSRLPGIPLYLPAGSASRSSDSSQPPGEIAAGCGDSRRSWRDPWVSARRGAMTETLPGLIRPPP